MSAPLFHFPNGNEAIHHAPLIIDEDMHHLIRGSKCIPLRAKLWALFNEFNSKPNQLLSRNYLIEKIWHGNIYTGTTGLTHSVCHLRRIFKELELPFKIITVPKSGYILRK